MQGGVSDIAGVTLPGASVTLSNLSTGLERVAIADTNGGFVFKVVRDGRYRLTATPNGFAPASHEVESGSVGAVEFALHPAALAERVTVVSGWRQEELRESLNTKVDVIGRARIRDTSNESVAEVLQELPGVVTRRGTQGAGAAGEQIQGIQPVELLRLEANLSRNRSVRRGGQLHRQPRPECRKAGEWHAAADLSHGAWPHVSRGNALHLGEREEIARVQFLGAAGGGAIRKMRPMKASAGCRSMRLRQGNCVWAVGQVLNLPHASAIRLFGVRQVENLPYTSLANSLP
ncbi:MAG: carboxypeptidase regulatory-like domain-containing protein [Acidobacteriota bacterium]